MIRTLLVDDDALTLELHRSYLERLDGFEVAGECTGARAAVSAVLDQPASQVGTVDEAELVRERAIEAHFLPQPAARRGGEIFTGARVSATGIGPDAGRMVLAFRPPLEQQVVPLYYDRDEQLIPHGWVDRMKHALCVAGQRFTARRMVEEYVCRHYTPAIRGELDGDDPPTA